MSDISHQIGNEVDLSEILLLLWAYKFLIS